MQENISNEPIRMPLEFGLWIETIVGLGRYSMLESLAKVCFDDMNISTSKQELNLRNFLFSYKDKRSFYINAVDIIMNDRPYVIIQD